MGALAEFQDAFARALMSEVLPDDLPPALTRLARQPGFSVYRNTVLTGWADAIAANFPAVVRLMGEAWMRGAAIAYARAQPPRDPRLHLYGEEFPDFLAGFPPAVEYSYLPAVARLDRLWTEAHAARDVAPLPPTAFGRLDQTTTLALHPRVRVAWFEHTAPTLWLDARGFTPTSSSLVFEPAPEGLLVARSGGEVRALKLSSGGYALLAACRAGRPFAEACAAALESEPDIDLLSLGRAFAEMGVFTGGDAPCPL